MEQESLKARVREERGSTAARRMRRAGELPANVTGLGKDPRALTIPEHDFEKLYRAGAQLVTIETGEETLEAPIREDQFDTFGDKVLHVDFEEIQRGITIQVEVKLEFFGEPAGVSEGGVFQTLMDTLTVTCMPRHIPGDIEVDVRELAAGSDIRTKDIVLPENVELEGIDPEEIVAMVSQPTIVEEEEEIEGEEESTSAEPEVIGKGKEEGEEEQD
jgi:large subunit ribosomal protein L25